MLLNNIYNNIYYIENKKLSSLIIKKIIIYNFIISTLKRKIIFLNIIKIF